MTSRPSFFVNLRIHQLVVKIHPDALIVAAVAGPAGDGTMLADRAAAGGQLERPAVTLGVLRHEIGRAQIPFDCLR